MEFRLSRQRLALVAGGLALLLFAYGSVLTHGPFGINDDYQYLYRVHAGTFNPAHNEQTGMGRPLASWGFETAYLLCDGRVARLVWLRAFALAGVGLFAGTLYGTLRAGRFPRWSAATTSALVALSPACGVYAAWTAGMFSPYALTAALLAGRLLGGAARWRKEIAGGLLLVAACMVWQAAAPLALFPALLDTWQLPGRPDKKPWWRPWLVCGVAVMFYAALCWLTYRLGIVSGADTQRLALATDPASKLWFLVDLLHSGITSWARLQPGIWEWIVGILTTVACLVSFAGRAEIARRTGVAAAMLLLGVLPLLAARENNAAFRSLPVLYLTVTFLGVEGLRRLLRGRPAGVRFGIALALVAASASAARYHVWNGLVSPGLREYVGLREQIRAQFPDGPPDKLVYLVPPPTLLAADRMTPSWEYGLVSSPFWWVTRPLLLLLFEEISPGRPASPGLTIFYREAGHPGVPVLQSLPALLREPGTWQDDPHWGRVQAFSHGWLYSPWFGYLSVEKFPVIQHHLLGPLIFTSQARDAKDLWFYHDGLGQFFTNAQAFPYLFISSSNGWNVLSDGDPAHLSLDDPATGQHHSYPR